MDPSAEPPSTGSPNAPPTAVPARPVAYRLAGAAKVRLLGLSLVVLGLWVLIVAIVVAASPLSHRALTWVVAVAAVLLIAAAVWLGRGPVVLRLDQTGYRVHFIRGCGVTVGRWADVHDLETATVGGARCAVLRLRDGRTTTLPVDFLRGDPEEFVRELGRRLQARG